MRQGVFSSLSESYIQAGHNVYYYVNNSYWVLKPFTFILAIIFSMVLVPVGFIFGMFIIFDIFGSTTDKIRKLIISSMENQSYNISNSLLSFLIRPIILLLIAPIFLISLVIPKVSSDAMVNVSSQQLSNAIDGGGVFRRLNKILWSGVGNLFYYIKYAPMLIKPFALLIAIIYSIVLIVVGFLFIFLIPLDWISQIIESIRQFIVRYVDEKQYRIRYDGWAFLFTPATLVILSPLFLVMILIPKFTTNIID